MTFKPTSTLERHQKYFDAFLISPGEEIFYGPASYLNFITKFINDPNISHQDQEDLQFFKDLLFESQFGKIHIQYYTWVIDKWTQYAFPQAIRVLARYADFLGGVSVMFLHDFYHHLFKLPKHDLTIAIFPILSSINKVEFIKTADQYPAIIAAMPKLKLYMVFS